MEEMPQPTVTIEDHHRAKAVDRLLSQAVENGHGDFLRDASPAEVAADLASYSPEMEDVPPQELEPFVAAWQAEQRGGETSTAKPRATCLAHLVPEPCGFCAAYIAGGL